MAALIFEILCRELNHYHHLKVGTTRIGRALDNDIILSDPTVSPYHLSIRCTDKGYWLDNLSDENGVFIDGKKIPLGEQSIQSDTQLQLGRLKVQLASPNRSISETLTHGCHHFLSCLFYRPSAAIFLTILSISLILYNFHTLRFNEVKISEQFTFALGGLFTIIILAGIFSAFIRMASKHWNLLPAYIFSSINVLLINLINLLNPSMNYIFNSIWPARIIDLITDDLLMPIASYAFCILLIGMKKKSALILTLILSSPFLFLTATIIYQWLPENKEFTQQPTYNETLLSHDIRWQKNIDLDQLIVKAKQLETYQESP